MRLAIKAARRGIQRGQTPFGACIVKGGQVLSATHNTVWKTTNITAHAEINAIRSACRKLGSIDLSGAVIYSTCEPCPMCFSACHWARLSLIVCGAGIKDAQLAGFNELTIPNEKMKSLGKSRINIIRGILPEEAAALFKEWKRMDLSKKY